MKTKLFDWRDVEIWREDDKYYVIYDAGSITEIVRRDEISPEEASFGCRGPEQAIQMLQLLQQRLSAAGIDPYTRNL